MTKQTENKIGGVGIEWELRSESYGVGKVNGVVICSYTVDDLDGVLLDDVLLTMFLPFSVVPLQENLIDCSSITKAKQKAQEILDDFVWGVLDKEGLREMIRDAFIHGYLSGLEVGLDGKVNIIPDSYMQDEADQYIKDTFGKVSGVKHAETLNITRKNTKKK